MVNKADLDNLEDRLTKLIKQETDRAAAKEKTLIEKISNLEIENINLKTQLDDNKNTVLQTIKTWIDSLTESIRKTNKEMGALAYRVDSEEKQLGREREDFTSQESVISGLNTRIENLNNEIATVKMEVQGRRDTEEKMWTGTRWEKINNKEPSKHRSWGSTDSLSSNRMNEGDEDLHEGVKFLNVMVESTRGDVNQCFRDMESMDRDIKFLIDKVTYLEDYSRRDNVKFFNIPEKEGESWDDCEKKVTDIVFNNMKLGALESRPLWGLVRAHRVGKYNANKTRPIVAKFYDFKIKQEVIGNAGVLYDEGIYSIAEDFSIATTDLRKKLYERAKSDKSLKLVYNRLIKKNR